MCRISFWRWLWNHSWFLRSMFDSGGARSSQEVLVPRDGLQVSLWAADQDVWDQPGLPGSSQVTILNYSLWNWASVGKLLNDLSPFYLLKISLSLCYLCDRYKKRFHKFDKECKGFITTVDVQQVLDVSRPSLYFFRLVFHPRTLVFITRYRLVLLFFCLRRASTSRLMKIPCMKSLMRWTSTRTDKWKLMNSCRYVTRGQISVRNVKTSNNTWLFLQIFHFYCSRLVCKNCGA